MLGSGRGAGCESVRAGCLGVPAGLWKEGLRVWRGCPPGLPLPQRTTRCDRHLVASPESGLRSGVRLGKQPGPPKGGWGPQLGLPGCWMRTVLWACTCWILPWTHTRKLRSGGHGGGGSAACAQSTRPHQAPGFAFSQAWVRWAARAGRAGQRKEHSSPCADGPRRVPAAPGSAPVPPPRSDPGRGGAVLAQVEP